MQRTLTAELPARRPGETVTVQGWVHRRRTLARVTFVVIRDRSGLVQVVVKNRATVEQVARYGEETVASVSGVLSANESAPGGVKVVDPVFEPLTEPAVTPPVELWRPTMSAGLPTLLDRAPVTLRHPRSKAAWQIAAASLHGFRQALSAEQFVEIQTPKLVTLFPRDLHRLAP